MGDQVDVMKLPSTRMDHRNFTRGWCIRGCAELGTLGDRMGYFRWEVISAKWAILVFL